MLYHFLYPLREYFFAFNVFRYISFRAAMAALTSFSLCILLSPLVIKYLKKLNISQFIRKHPEVRRLQAGKEGTPTMGGILILSAIAFSNLLWADIANKFILMSLLAVFWLGLLGFRDDYLKLKNKGSRGLLKYQKLIFQSLLGLIIGLVLYFDPEVSATVTVPFLKNAIFNLGVVYILFVMLVIVGTSNAVNLTDGLDGLAIGCVTIVAFTYAVLSYVSGHVSFSEYLLIPYIQGTGELAVFCASIVGAGLGFLWFNCYPASFFMGDIGSLALGGSLGVVAVFIKKELLLVIVGGIFVVEALSVILQVFSYRVCKRRIFRMAPLHHHFQELKWSESKIIVRFWIVAIVLSLLTLLTLKLR